MKNKTIEELLAIIETEGEKSGVNVFGKKNRHILLAATELEKRVTEAFHDGTISKDDAITVFEWIRQVRSFA